MLPRKHRISRSNFKNLGRPERSFSGNFLVLQYFSHSDPMRVAVVVGKKVAKKAVVRNRLRRLIYNTIRLSGLPAEKTGLMIIRLRRKPEQVIDLRDDLQNVLQGFRTWKS